MLRAAELDRQRRLTAPLFRAKRVEAAPRPADMAIETKALDLEAARIAVIGRQNA